MDILDLESGPGVDVRGGSDPVPMISFVVPAHDEARLLGATFDRAIPLEAKIFVGL